MVLKGSHPLFCLSAKKHASKGIEAAEGILAFVRRAIQPLFKSQTNQNIQTIQTNKTNLNFPN
jgi:hypothetical protein